MLGKSFTEARGLSNQRNYTFNRFWVSGQKPYSGCGLLKIAGGVRSLRGGLVFVVPCPTWIKVSSSEKTNGLVLSQFPR